MQMPRFVHVMVATMVAGVVAVGQAPRASAANALVDVLVWGTHMSIDPNGFPQPLRAEVEQYLRRSAAYRSPRPRPVNSSELGMVHDAWVTYERRLVAISEDSTAQALAVAYLDSLRPCYEWEGFHECPEREAMFAEGYQGAHPGGPFSEYLPLLAAHRWLCAAEAYEGEKRPQDAARSRQAYERQIVIAIKVPTLLIRTAAEGLLASKQCFSPR